MLKTAAGLVALVVAVWALTSRYLPITNHVVLASAALSPYLLLCGPAALALLLLSGRWRIAMAAVVVTGAALVIQVPIYLPSAAAHDAGIDIRVVTANLYEGNADPDELVKEAQAQADVLAVQELTPGEVRRLAAAGMNRAFPYRWLAPGSSASGVGMWSRYPMHTTRHINGYTMAAVSARVHIAGVLVDPTVLVVHPAGPWPWPIDDWRGDITKLPLTLDAAARGAADGAVIVAGDLNSTVDMQPFRRLLGSGYRDAADQSGSGLKPTFPADRRFPPLLAIDHVLTRNCSATSLHTVVIGASDHLGLAATVTIPRSPPTESAK